MESHVLWYSRVTKIPTVNIFQFKIKWSNSYGGMLREISITLENRNGSWRIELLRKGFWGRGTVSGCGVTVSFMLCVSTYTYIFKQIVKIGWKQSTFAGNQLQNRRVCFFNGSTKYNSYSKPHKMFVPYHLLLLRSVISRNRVHFAGTIIFKSIYHWIHMALRYHQSNSWLVPVVF